MLYTIMVSVIGLSPNLAIACSYRSKAFTKSFAFTAALPSFFNSANVFSATCAFAAKTAINITKTKKTRFIFRFFNGYSTFS